MRGGGWCAALYARREARSVLCNPEVIPSAT